MHYNGQPIGIIVAETLNAAWHAASLVQVSYRATSPRLDLKAASRRLIPDIITKIRAMSVGVTLVAR